MLHPANTTVHTRAHCVCRVFLRLFVMQSDLLTGVPVCSEYHQSLSSLCVIYWSLFTSDSITEVIDDHRVITSLYQLHNTVAANVSTSSCHQDLLMHVESLQHRLKDRHTKVNYCNYWFIVNRYVGVFYSYSTCTWTTWLYLHLQHPVSLYMNGALSLMRSTSIKKSPTSPNVQETSSIQSDYTGIHWLHKTQ